VEFTAGIDLIGFCDQIFI